MFLPYAASIDNHDRSLNANPALKAYNTRYISVDCSGIIRAEMIIAGSMYVCSDTRTYYGHEIIAKSIEGLYRCR